jgi:molecular chaperone DnaJ
MNMPRDYYAILGVSRDADTKNIKKAYRNIIKFCHPDSPDCRMSHDELLAVQEAYETLIDPEKRARYDSKNSVRTILSAGSTPPVRSGHRTGDRSPFVQDAFLSDFLSMLDDVPDTLPFYARPRPERTSIPRLELILTPKEAKDGGLFEIPLPGPGGIPTGSVTVMLPPNIRSGTRARVDLSRTHGIRGVLSITIIVEGQEG